MREKRSIRWASTSQSLTYPHRQTGTCPRGCVARLPGPCIPAAICGVTKTCAPRPPSRRWCSALEPQGSAGCGCWELRRHHRTVLHHSQRGISHVHRSYPKTQQSLTRSASCKCAYVCICWNREQGKGAAWRLLSFPQLVPDLGRLGQHRRCFFLNNVAGLGYGPISLACDAAQERRSLAPLAIPLFCWFN